MRAKSQLQRPGDQPGGGVCAPTGRCPTLRPKGVPGREAGLRVLNAGDVPVRGRAQGSAPVYLPRSILCLTRSWVDEC